MTYANFINILQKKNIDPDRLPQLLVEQLAAGNLKIATAESCTGGLVSKKITGISGSSAVFDCGVCSYANTVKHKVLGVKSATLAQYGAVSPQTACEMAKGVRMLSGAHIGVSTTGIAGPSGGTAKKPVGLVYIGISTAWQTIAAKAQIWGAPGLDREQIRNTAADMALFYGLNIIKML